MRPIPRPNLRRDLPRLIVLSVVFWLGIGVGAGEQLPFVVRPDTPPTAEPLQVSAAAPAWLARYVDFWCFAREGAAEYMAAHRGGMEAITPGRMQEILDDVAELGFRCTAVRYLGKAEHLDGSVAHLFVMDVSGPNGPTQIWWALKSEGELITQIS